MTNVEQSASGSEADLRPLPENVEGHAMGRFHMHPDGRFCMYHHRLGAWTPDHLNECTREHDEQPKQRA